jgi:hypothetical protein
LLLQPPCALCLLTKMYAMPGFFHSFIELKESPRKLSFSCVKGCALGA